MAGTTVIESPNDASLNQLCRELAERAAVLDATGDWPTEQLALCGRYGVYQWFVSRDWGGQGWSQADVVRGYLRLSEACLATTFILTQRTGACRRIETSGNEQLKAELLPKLAAGELFASVGLSQLTTSRRHLDRPALRARELDDGFVLDGYSPWVTGGPHCDHFVLGATLEDGRQILVCVPRDLRWMKCGDPERLIALAASHTGSVYLDAARIERRWLLHGPAENVMARGGGVNTGGLETSTLAVGLASAAIRFLEQQSRERRDLLAPAEQFRTEQLHVHDDLLKLAEGDPACSTEQLRVRANRLALRSTQSALTAAKGAGYVVGHAAGRWCREAMFFLVWSCPQPVVQAALCELASLD